MIRDVGREDLETMRQTRNLYYKLGIFHQHQTILREEQDQWYENEKNPGVIITDVNGNWSYGKIYESGEVSFYGGKPKEWNHMHLMELLKHFPKDRYWGEAFAYNPYIDFWLEAGFKIVNVIRKRKFWEGRDWDSYMLEYQNEDLP